MSGGYVKIVLAYKYIFHVHVNVFGAQVLCALICVAQKPRILGSPDFVLGPFKQDFK